MNIEEYNQIWKELNTYEDVEKLSEAGYERELLFVLYTEKHVRNVKRSYYKVTGQSKRLLQKWRGGDSFTKLADDLAFSPMLMASILMRENGFTKRQAREALKDPNAIKNERIQAELMEATARDMVYSELGAKLQRERGKQGEAKIRSWLEARGRAFKEEADLKSNGGKTVDFLLDEPLEVEFQTGAPHEKIYWIESKASFGDMSKMKRDYEKQLKPYTELWGPGMVVYWFGYLEDMELWLEARDVKLVRSDFFDG
ncbi:MAG: TPD domain-containing protein [Candidatus Diapherotrites archaeon]|nr:TPD domain-containing protein [Candidatus Diapherotrites archaeon]